MELTSCIWVRAARWVVSERKTLEGCCIGHISTRVKSNDCYLKVISLALQPGCLSELNSPLIMCHLTQCGRRPPSENQWRRSCQMSLADWLSNQCAPLDSTKVSHLNKLLISASEFRLMHGSNSIDLVVMKSSLACSIWKSTKVLI